MKTTDELGRIYNESHYEHGSYRGYTRWYFKVYHFFKFFPAGFWCKFFLHAKTVLDIGCADGMSVWVFRKVFGLRAYGVEVSQWATRHAIKSIKEYIVSGSIEDEALKLPLERFDVVVSFDTFEHLQPDNLEKTIKRIFTVTDTLFCSIYVLDEFVAFLQNLFGTTHVSHFSEHSSSWWMEFFSKLDAMATRAPFGRRGTFLIRKKQ